jgi:hypothetical protein
VNIKFSGLKRKRNAYREKEKTGRGLIFNDTYTVYFFRHRVWEEKYIMYFPVMTKVPLLSAMASAVMTVIPLLSAMASGDTPSLREAQRRSNPGFCNLLISFSTRFEYYTVPGMIM